MLRRKRKGSKQDAAGEGEHASVELPSARHRAVTSGDSGVVVVTSKTAPVDVVVDEEEEAAEAEGRANGSPLKGKRWGSKREQQQHEVEAEADDDDERETDRDKENKKKGSRMVDLKELMSQTKKNITGSGTLSRRWTGTRKKSMTSSHSSSDLRVHSAGSEGTSDGDSESPPESPVSRPRTERKQRNNQMEGTGDSFVSLSERPLSSRSASSSLETRATEELVNNGKASLGAGRKPRKLLTDRPAKRHELDDGDEPGGHDKAITNLKLLPVELLESKRGRGSSVSAAVPPILPSFPTAAIPPPLSLSPDSSSSAAAAAMPLPSVQLGFLTAPLPPPLDLPVVVAVPAASGKAVAPPLQLNRLLSAPLPPPLNLSPPTITTQPQAQKAQTQPPRPSVPPPGIPRRIGASSKVPSHSSPMPAISLSAAPPAMTTSGSKVALKPRPVLPALRLPMGAPTHSAITSLTSRAVYSPAPLSPSLSLVSPRYTRSGSSLDESGDGRVTPKSALSTTRSFESGGDLLDKTLEEMIHSRWEEYDNIRRLRSGNRRYRQSQRMSLFCEPNSIDKLQTDANVFLGAIKEMVKQRTQMRTEQLQQHQHQQQNQTTTEPKRGATTKNRRQRERVMRMSRERKNRASTNLSRQSRCSISLSSSDGTEASTDEFLNDTTTLSTSPPPSLSSSPGALPPLPPPPPVPPSGDTLLGNPPGLAEEDVKWGVNMLASEQPQVYEDLFTLLPSEIENVPGIYRWRIENLLPVWLPPQDEEHPINHFYESDCYLVLYVGRGGDEDDELEDGSPLKKDGGAGEKESTMTYNLHYWIGRTSSVDKKASVCFRAVQLNSYIGGKAKHYPEEHGDESTTFRLYFRRRRSSLSSASAGAGARSRSNSSSAGAACASPSIANTHSAPLVAVSEESDLVYLEGGTDSGLRRVKAIREYDTARLYRFFTLEDDDDDEEDEQASSDDPWAYYAIDEFEAAARRRRRNGYHYFVQLVELAASSLNERDVFLLDTGGYRLFQWNGKQSRQKLNLICNETLLMMNVIERKSLAQIEVLSEEVEDLAGRKSRFWRYLDGTHKRWADDGDDVDAGAEGGEEQDVQGQAVTEDSPAQPAPQAGDLADEAPGGILEILEVRGEYGSMDLHTMWVQKKPSVLRASAAAAIKPAHEEGIKPSRRILSSQGVFIIDCTSEIFVYSGCKSTPYSRQIALFIANQMKDDDIKDDSARRPVWTMTMEVNEREEPILFKARFSDWLDTDDSGKWGAKQKVAARDYRPFHEQLLDEIKKKGKLKPPELPEIDLAALFPPRTHSAQKPATPEPAAAASEANAQSGEADEILELLNRVRASSLREDVLMDSSSVEVGILSGRTFSKLPEAELGHFYSGECYVVLHSFHDKAKDARQWVVYFWEGKSASMLKWPTFQLGIFPALEEKIVSSGGGCPEKRRIYQGEETPVFMSLFKNNLIVIRRGQRPRTATATMEMFEAKCQLGDPMKRLVSVECGKDSLHSSGAYGLFLSSGKVFIWRGAKSLEQSVDALTWLIDATTAALQKESSAASAAVTSPPGLRSPVASPSGSGISSHSPALKSPSAPPDASTAARAISRSSDDTDGSENCGHRERRNGVEIHFIAEGEEPYEFWAALGCTSPRPTGGTTTARTDSARARGDGADNGQGGTVTARLAKLCYDGGKFSAAEMVDYKQRDLLQNCVYLLYPTPSSLSSSALWPSASSSSSSSGTASSNGKLYLWLGRQITDRLLGAARHTAKRYATYVSSRLHATTTGRPADTPVVAALPPIVAESDVSTEATTDASVTPSTTADECTISSSTSSSVCVEEVEDGRESSEFTRYFADWTSGAFVDPYELRLIELQRLGAGAFDYSMAAGEDQREPLIQLVDADGTDEIEAEAQPTPEELEERKRREREEFMRKLREDRQRKEERRRQREKKEEEERLRRREKQDRLRAKLKMLELQVVHYNTYDDDADGAAAREDAPAGSELGPDGEQRRSVSARDAVADGESPLSRQQRAQSTDMAVVRLKERQVEFISRLKNRSRSRISYAGKDRSSASSVNLLQNAGLLRGKGADADAIGDESNGDHQPPPQDATTTV